MAKIKLMNVFNHTNGFDILLAVILVEGTIEVGSNLLLQDGTKIPIMGKEKMNVITDQPHMALTVSGKIHSSIKWHQLFGNEILIE